MHKRNIIAFCLVLVLMSSVCVWARPSFKDVKTKDWFYTAVHFASENDIMRGVSSTRFDPNGQVSRAMLATVLYRISGSTVTYKRSTFKDNKRGLWYFDGIEYCARMNIVGGYGNGYFGPDDLLTREDMMTMLYRAVDMEHMDLTCLPRINVDYDADIAALLKVKK